MSDLMELVDGCEKAKLVEVKSGGRETAEDLALLGFQTAAKDLFAKLEAKEKMAKIGAYGYVKITRKAIEAYLDRKVAAYNKEHAPKAEKKKSGSLRDVLMNPRDWQVQYYSEFDDRPSRQRQAATSDGTQLDPSRLQDMVRLFGQAQARIIDESIAELGNYVTIPRHGLSASEATAISRATIHANGDGPVGKFVWTEERVENYAAAPPADVLKNFKTHKDRQVFDYYTVASVNEVKDPLLLGRISGSEDRYFLAQWGEDVSLDDLI